MSRPDEPATELDALLARPTPQPGGEEGPAAKADRPARGRLESWLRGGIDRGGTDEAEADVPETGDVVADVPEADVPETGDARANGAGTAGRSGDGPRWTGEDRSADRTGGAIAGAVDRAEDGAVDGGGVDGDVLRSVPVVSIEPNSYQPRRHFDEESLAALTESVAALGVLQPIVVREVSLDRFELVAGERRWRAAQRAGLRMIPALVRVTDDQGALEQAIVENLHRQDLNSLEEAAAYRELVEDFGLTQDEVARRVGKSRSAVANVLRLLQLAPGVQRLLIDGQVSAGHARALLGLSDGEAQIALAKRVVEEELSVRQTEEAVRAWAERGSGADPSTPSRREKSIGALEVQMILEERLETRVEIQESGRGGRLVVRFADGEDLDRIVGLIGETDTDG